nr:MAG TPA: hypothetical protein [Caudoviricetes sp.]
MSILTEKIKVAISYCEDVQAIVELYGYIVRCIDLNDKDMEELTRAVVLKLEYLCEVS